MKNNSILKDKVNQSSSTSKRHKTTADRRFVASEQRLKKIVLEMARAERGISFSVTEFCNRGDFNRRTFYRHYSSVAQCISRQAAAHQNDIKVLAAELLNNSLSHEANLCKMLYFISKHKDDYATSLIHANFFFFRTLAESMKPLVLKEWAAIKNNAKSNARTPKNNDSDPNTSKICSSPDDLADNPQLDKKYMDFSFEVIAKLVWWVQSEGAEKAEIPNLVNHIMVILRKYAKD